MNIFVGNLSFEAKEIDVKRVFMAFGVVTSVAIVMEKKGKKSRGFGFVQMPDEQEALAAIAQLQGKEILGRPINVMPALSKEPKKNKGDGSTFLDSSSRKIEPSPFSFK
ncbi:MAG: RNA-binding protein, partial [Candidatus Omnitrophota bacterium]|nr:RNA-binding protein [Candidatus Omnitrophota bacterium]